MRAPASGTKTALFVMIHGGWRILAASIIVVAPLYGWVLFYYLATAAWHQPAVLVRMHAPVLATFVVPIIIGAWILGFRRWYLAGSALFAVIIASRLPSVILANRLLPASYLNVAVVLILLMIGLRIFQYWREYVILQLPVSRYTTGVCLVVAATTAGLLTLLMPIQL